MTAPQTCKVLLKIIVVGRACSSGLGVAAWQHRCSGIVKSYRPMTLA